MPPSCRPVPTEWLAPPVTDLRAILGPNFDPLVGWARDPSALQSAEPFHCRQAWWSERLGRKALDALHTQSGPRDLKPPPN